MVSRAKKKALKQQLKIAVGKSDPTHFKECETVVAASMR